MCVTFDLTSLARAVGRSLVRVLCWHCGTVARCGWRTRFARTERTTALCPSKLLLARSEPCRASNSFTQLLRILSISPSPFKSIEMFSFCTFLRLAAAGHVGEFEERMVEEDTNEREWLARSRVTKSNVATA
jgi:hypothetical protein